MARILHVDRLFRATVLTSNQRLHWAEKARRTAHLRSRGAAAWAQAGRPQLDAAHLTVTVTYPDRRARDVHNLIPTVKALIDGAVHPYAGHRGVLPDDSDAYLTGPDMRACGYTPGQWTFTLRWDEPQARGA